MAGWTTTKRSPEARLRQHMSRGGNWRLKALLDAALPTTEYTAEDMGRALYDYAKHRDRYEHALEQGDDHSWRPMPARQLSIRPLSYDKDFKEVDAARELAKSDTKLDIGTEDDPKAIDQDKYAGRMLIGESERERDVLWREDLIESVIMGAEEAKVARDVSNVTEVDTRKGDHPVRASEIFAEKIAEAGPIPNNEVDYSTNSWTTEKYGLGALITEELIDHALIDVIEDHVRWIGAAVENSFNRVFMNELVDNGGANGSGSDIETNAGTTAPYGTDLDALVQARNVAVGGNWPVPDTIVMHDQFQMGIVLGNNDHNLTYSNRAGEFDAKMDARFPAGLFGFDNVALVPDGPYNGSNNWGYDTDGHYGAAVYPRELMFTYIRRDVETKDFDDPIRDLEGVNARGEFDAVWGQSAASALIKN